MYEGVWSCRVWQEKMTHGKMFCWIDFDLSVFKVNVVSQTMKCNTKYSTSKFLASYFSYFHDNASQMLKEIGSLVMYVPCRCVIVCFSVLQADECILFCIISGPPETYHHTSIASLISILIIQQNWKTCFILKHYLLFILASFCMMSHKSH